MARFVGLGLRKEQNTTEIRSHFLLFFTEIDIGLKHQCHLLKALPYVCQPTNINSSFNQKYLTKRLR